VSLERISGADLAAWIDKLAIRELLERYMRYDDDGDLDRILELFDPDATYQVVGRVMKGREQIREFLARSFVSALPHWTEPGRLLVQTPSTHVVSNPVIELNGDEATVESDFIVARRDENGRARIVLLGRYRDHVRRGSDGSWRLYVRTGVSVARPGQERTDTEWQQALERSTPEERANLVTSYARGST
jgi:uncharacterized protein (TIGR02246 family)